jgi:hypothetical protein
MSALTLTRAIELPQVLFLIACYVKGYWLVKPDGAIIANDFVNVWAAGRQVLEGHAAAAYDHHVHKATEDLAVGHALTASIPGIIRLASCSSRRRCR